MRMDEGPREAGPEEIRRASELRDNFRVIRGDNLPIVGRLPAIPETFYCEPGQLSSSRVAAQFTNDVLRVRCALMLSPRNQPFIDLSHRDSEKTLAVWPLFCRIGGDNGPGSLELPGWDLSVTGRMGKLTLDFERSSGLGGILRKMGDALGQTWGRQQISFSGKMVEDQFSFQSKFSGKWRGAA